MRVNYHRLLEMQLALLGFNSLRLKAKDGLALARLSFEIDREVKIFAEARNKLVKDLQILPEKLEDGDIMKFSCLVEGDTDEETIVKKRANLEEFSSSFQELLNQEVDLPDIKIIIPDNLELSFNTIRSLLGVIEVGEGA